MRASSRSIDQLASEAKFLSVGVFCDLARLSEVAEWADARFLERASPPTSLMDIAFATKGNRLELVRDLDRIADRGGAKELSEADVRTLLDRLAWAIDDDRFTPREATMALEWIVDNMASHDHLTEEVREATSRFRVGLPYDVDPKLAWSELRRWLEHVRRDPSAARTTNQVSRGDDRSRGKT